MNIDMVKVKQEIETEVSRLDGVKSVEVYYGGSQGPIMWLCLLIRHDGGKPPGVLNYDVTPGFMILTNHAGVDQSVGLPSTAIIKDALKRGLREG